MVSIMRSVSDLDPTDVDLDLHLSDSDVEDVLSKIDETGASPSKPEAEMVLTVDMAAKTEDDAPNEDGQQTVAEEEQPEDVKLAVEEEAGPMEAEISRPEADETEKVAEAEVDEGKKEPEEAPVASVEETEGEAEAEAGSQEQDESDLLLVMEEKSTEIDDTEFNKNVIDQEQAASASPTDELDKADESTTNESSVSPGGATCADELMDIGDNIVEVGEVVQKEEDAAAEEEELRPSEAGDHIGNDDEPEEIISTPDISSMGMLPPDAEILTMGVSAPPASDRDSNKENETDVKQMEKGAARISRDSSRKRQSEGRTARDNVKKLKMDESASLRATMIDKELTCFTRKKLEVLVLQKICEALVYKSEVGELRKAMQDKELMVDALRKEVVALSKQAKDMKLVNEKLIHDLTRFKATSERPLLVPRITRSVGLQAIARDPPKKEPGTAGAVKAGGVSAPSPSHHVSARPAVRKSGAALKPKPPPVADAAKPIAPKMLLPKQGASLTPIKVAPKPEAAKSCVIDLTSDDERKPPAGHKIVLVNGQGVLVKVANNSPMAVLASPPTGAGASLRPVQASVLKCANSPNTTAKVAPKAGGQTSVAVRAGGVPPQRRAVLGKKKHPAPFPGPPPVKMTRNTSKAPPPRPELKLSKTPCGKGIVLSWKMPYRLALYEDIASYQLFAYQETKAEPSTDNWGKIGDVKALPLPMAVTLTQFAIGNRYYFAVRAVDVLTRIGEFSDYQTISL